jgi:Transposase DDE domain
MVLSEVFQQFVKESPVCVMVRATLENVLSAERVDDLFARTAVQQRPGELLFSSVADLMGLVVARIRPSVHAAYQARAESLRVSLAALYDKLRGIEPNVSRTLVRDTAERMGAIVRQTGGALPELLSGYRVLIADGNHLPATERRLKELRTRNVAPLPGHAVVLFDPAQMLAVDVLPCADGHASERTLLPALLERLEAKDLLIADRNFCTTQFLLDIDRRGAFFVIRQHGSSLKYELVGRRRKIGRIDTGMVYEQDMRLLGAHDATLVIRRITIQLDQPTRDGDDEIHVLSNLPAKIKALKLATLYRERWTVEGAFQEMEAHLKSEIETLAYPQAALFAFCLALVSYNVLSVVKAALRGAHGHAKIEAEVSSYYLADEVAGVSRGMTVLLPGDFWYERFAKQTPSQMAQFLLTCARQVRLSAFRKHPRGPKKPSASKSKKGRVHVATQKIIDRRKRTPALH